MVKGVARSGASATSSGTGAPPAALPTMQTGQNVHDPLTALNSHQAFGLAGSFNPFAGTGLNLNDPNLVRKCAGHCIVSQADSSLDAANDGVS
jgi:ubiquilin